VAKTAVTRVDGKETVFVLIGENAVETRHVKLGLEDSDRVEVVSGLKPGERVATSGVFALKAELFR
jgi:cobalt-zinc-cadmium efflux system membrane fusion protein